MNGGVAEEYLGEVEADAPRAVAAAVMDQLAENLKTNSGAADRFKQLSGAASAIAEIAKESDDPTKVVKVARSSAGEVAQKSGIPKDTILDEIKEETGSLEKEAVEESGGLQLDVGIGLDRFLEDHLEEIVIQRSTDAVASPIFRWRFDEGERVETEEGVHFDTYHFFKLLSGATERRLQTKLASEQAEEIAETDQEYARLSVGPVDRPWARDGDAWAQSVSGLIEERSREETVVGPRTEAWESIRTRISSGSAVRDIDDAVKQSMIYVDEDTAEIWVPTSMVSDACESVETSRRALQSELAERGVDSDELSGNGISEALSSDGTASRYWRLDATHEEVPEPDEVIDEIEDPTKRNASVDGGPEPTEEPPSGTESFGRPAPDGGDESEDDTEDGGQEE